MEPIRSAIVSVALCIAFVTTGNSIDALAQAKDTGSETSSQTVGASDAKAAKIANRALRGVVIRQLSRTRGLDIDGINVIAVNGIVTLVGTVPDTYQIELATQVAREVAGVREVRNCLTLQTNGK